MTYTLIKLSPLSSCNKAFAVGVPRHTGQTVFMGLGHFGPQLPRLVTKGIVKESRKTEEKRKIGGEGRQREETLSKNGGGVS